MNEIIAEFELTADISEEGGEKAFNSYFLFDKLNNKDLGKGNIGKFYGRIWNLSPDGKDDTYYISVGFQQKAYSFTMRLGNKHYQIALPIGVPVELIFTEADERVKDFRGCWILVIREKIRNQIIQKYKFSLQQKK